MQKSMYMYVVASIIIGGTVIGAGVSTSVSPWKHIYRDSGTGGQGRWVYYFAYNEHHSDTIMYFPDKEQHTGSCEEYGLSHKYDSGRAAELYQLLAYWHGVQEQQKKAATEQARVTKSSSRGNGVSSLAALLSKIDSNVAVSRESSTASSSSSSASSSSSSARSSSSSSSSSSSKSEQDHLKALRDQAAKTADKLAGWDVWCEDSDSSFYDSFSLNDARYDVKYSHEESKKK